MKTKILIILTLLVQVHAFASPPENGRSIFLSRCASCHNVNKQLVGPALAGVDQRRSMEWIIRFVTSSQSVIKSGDTTAVALFQKFNKVPMPDHSDLAAEDIKSIVEFIKSETKPATADQAPFAKPVKKMAAYQPLSLRNDTGFFIVFLLCVGLLMASLLFGVRVNEIRQKAAKKNAS